MIYKVQTDFKNLENIIKKLSKDFDILFFNNCLFASTKNLENVPDIRKILLPKSDFYITEVTEENLKFEHSSVIEWCKDNFIKADMQKFEKENQDKLRAIMKLLEETEIQMEEDFE